MRARLMASVLALVVAAGCGSGEEAAERAAEAQLGPGANVEIDRSAGGGQVDMEVETEEGTVRMQSTTDDAGQTTVRIEGPDGQSFDMESRGDGDAFSGTISGDGQTMTLSGGADAQLPADMPGDVPVYAPLQIELVQEMGGGTFMVTGLSEDSVDAIYTWYTQQASEQGWSAVTNQRMSMPMDMATLVLNKDGRNISLSVMDSEDGTRLTLNHTGQ